MLYKRFRNDPSPHTELVYKRFKNKPNHIIRMAKKLYYKKKIEETKGNVKQTWRLLNDILNKNYKNKMLAENFNVDGKEVSDPKQIAKLFCKYFSYDGPNLANKISPTHLSFRPFLKRNFVNSIFFETVSELEIREICSTFHAGTAAGYDGVSMALIKECILKCNLHPLIYIINLSIIIGIVPDDLKIARVIPLFKSGDSSLFTNYRSVSVLPAFSKIR